MTDADDGATFLGSIEKRLFTVSVWFAVLSAFSLCGMMVLTAIDVGGRYFFNWPLFGAYELIGMLLIIAGPFGMSMTQMERKHIAISLLVDRMPPRVRESFHALGLFISLVIYVMITIGMFKLTGQYWARGIEAASQDLGLSLAYVSFAFAIGALLFTLILILHFLQSLHSLIGRS